MKTENLQTEVYMTTEHRKNKKAKVTFATTLNKVIVNALILTSLAGGLAVPTNAYASTNTVDTTSNISINYDSSVESAVYNLQQTLTLIQGMLDSGLVDTDMLTNLASEVLTLTDAVNTSGKSASNEVIDIIAEVETTIGKLTPTTKNRDGINRVNAAVVSFKNFVDTGILEVTIEKTSADTYAAKATTTKATTKATYPTKFTDIKSGSTYYTAVTYLAKKGVIGGYKDSTYKASTKMTNSKFICMLVRTVNAKASRAVKGNDYSAKLMEEALTIGILKKYELSKENYNKPMTKADMALWVSRALEYMNEDTEEIKRISNLIADYKAVEALGSKYADAVKILVSEGIVTLDKDNKLNPKSGVSRGSAAVILARVSEAKYRKDMSKIIIPMHETTDRKVQTLKWSDKNRPLPQAGDTFIDKKSKKTVLTSIWVNGEKEIIGYGQNIQDLYGNMMNGLKAGELGGSVDGDNRYLGSPYLIDEATGVGYFQKDWLTIATYEDSLTLKVKNPKEGQVVGWTKFYKKYGWVFMGPQ